MTYWTKSPGTGGKIKSEEDFLVDEVPMKKFLVKFQRTSSGVSPVSGPYFLYLLKKKGRTTKDALVSIAKKLDINKNDIGYAGLKDKFATTSQYITLKKKVEGFKTNDLELSLTSPCGNMMSIGELEGNKFTITLHGCKNPKNVEKTSKELQKRGMPNYFGPQRFGVNKDNHKIGRMLLKRDDKALSRINKNYKKKYTSLKSIDKKVLKFFIHAYQSFVFNRVLDEYVKKNTKPWYESFPIAGFDTKLKSDFAGKETKRILEADGLTPESFRINELGLTCVGSVRSAFVDVKNIRCEISKNIRLSKAQPMLVLNTKPNIIVLEFELPKGSYATVLIREVVKDGRI